MRLEKITTKTLKESAKLLMNRFENGTDFAFNQIIDELEKRMPENEFIEFCETL